MKVSTLWLIVAFVWAAGCGLFGGSVTVLFAGLLWCAVGAWRGWLVSERHGIYR